MIEQWKYFGSKTSGYITINLSIAFTNTNYYLDCVSADASKAYRMFHCSINTRTTQSFKLSSRESDSGGDNEYTSSFVMFAKGY